MKSVIQRSVITPDIAPMRRYAGVLLRHRTGSLILQWRNDGKGGIVTTFGGGAETGEADVDAAIREVAEELNVTLSPALLEPLITLPKFDSAGLITCQYYTYAAPLDVENLVPAEGDGIVLLHPGDLDNPRLPVTPTTRNALEQYVRWAGGSLPPSTPVERETAYVDAYVKNRCLTLAEAATWTDIIATHCVKHRSSSPMRVLDLGVGPGRFLPLLGHTLKAEVTIGLDVSFAMVRRAACTGYAVLSGDAMKLPFGSNTFDVVWSFLVWHQLDDVATACREVRRVLQSSGGQFLIRTGFTSEGSEGALFDYFPSARRIQMSRYRTKMEVANVLQEAQFSDVRHVQLDLAVASTFDEYVKKVRSRAYSILWELSNEEYAAGLLRMEIDLQRGKDERVVLPCDLIVATT